MLGKTKWILLLVSLFLNSAAIGQNAQEDLSPAQVQHAKRLLEWVYQHNPGLKPRLHTLSVQDIETYSHAIAKAYMTRYRFRFTTDSHHALRYQQYQECLFRFMMKDRAQDLGNQDASSSFPQAPTPRPLRKLPPKKGSLHTPPEEKGKHPHLLEDDIFPSPTLSAGTDQPKEGISSVHKSDFLLAYQEGQDRQEQRKRRWDRFQTVQWDRPNTIHQLIDALYDELDHFCYLVKTYPDLLFLQDGCFQNTLKVLGEDTTSLSWKAQHLLQILKQLEERNHRFLAQLPSLHPEVLEGGDVPPLLPHLRKKTEEKSEGQRLEEKIHFLKSFPLKTPLEKEVFQALCLTCMTNALADYVASQPTIQKDMVRLIILSIKSLQEGWQPARAWALVFNWPPSMQGKETFYLHLSRLEKRLDLCLRRAHRISLKDLLSAAQQEQEKNLVFIQETIE